MRKHLLACTILLAAALSASAQEPSPAIEPVLVTHHYQLGVGPTSVLDTYLSQEKFRGTGISVLATSEHARRSSRWATIWQQQVDLSTVSDRADDGTEMEAIYHLMAGRYYAADLLPQHLTLQVGALANMGVGAIYNTRNSNNPANMRLGLQLMPSAIVSWRFPVLHRQTTLRYELELPLVGIAFSPNYGQSYYEMFSLGNYDHNAVPTTFVSAPCFRQQLSLAYRLGRRTTLSVGYLGDYQQLRVNNLKQQVLTHRIMFGVVHTFQKIKL